MTGWNLERATLQKNQRTSCARDNFPRGMLYGLILVAPFWTAAIAIVWAVRS